MILRKINSYWSNSIHCIIFLNFLNILLKNEGTNIINSNMYTILKEKKNIIFNKSIISKYCRKYFIESNIVIDLALAISSTKLSWQIKFSFFMSIECVILSDDVNKWLSLVWIIVSFDNSFNVLLYEIAISSLILLLFIKKLNFSIYWFSVLISPIY